MTAHIIVDNLQVQAGSPEQPVTIVHNVSFSLQRGEVLALIGESGSGKTTIALTMLGYARPGCWISGGAVMVGCTAGHPARTQSRLCGAECCSGI